MTHKRSDGEGDVITWPTTVFKQTFTTPGLPIYVTLPQNIRDIQNNDSISTLTCSLFLFSTAYRCEAFSVANF